MGETLTAIKLAEVETWRQLWTDATTRRKIPFTSLIIGLLGDEDNIDPVIVSSCIFMEDKRSDTGAEGIINKVSVHQPHQSRRSTYASTAPRNRVENEFVVTVKIALVGRQNASKTANVCRALFGRRTSATLPLKGG